jgi:hypothetical protein
MKPIELFCEDGLMRTFGPVCARRHIEAFMPPSMRKPEAPKRRTAVKRVDQADLFAGVMA